MANSKFSKWIQQNEETIAEDVKKGKENAFKELPLGTYIALYTEHAIVEKKSGDGFAIKTKLEVLEGEHAGETIHIYEDLDRERAMEFIVKRLMASGAEIEDESDIIAQFKKNENDLFDFVADKRVVKIKIYETTSKTNGEKYINKAVNAFIEDYEFDVFEEEEENTKSTKKEEEVKDDNEVELSVGQTVVFKYGKLTKEGEITELDFDNEIVKVQDDKGKIHELSSEAILEIKDAEAV